MVDWLRFGADMEDLATQTLRTGKQVTGLLRPTVIQPYRGFVADGVANIRARVMEEPVFDATPKGLRIDATLAANLLRWVVLDIAGIEVTVTMGDRSVKVNSNENGFVIAKIPVDDDLEPGWHEVFFSAEDQGEEITAKGRVVLPDPGSEVGFITDIDDTILATGMTEGLKAVQRTLLRDAYGRKPVPGTPSLYRGLARGAEHNRPEATFFYVSSGPWNLYDMLIQFLGVRGFPRGPIFLTDWRPGAPVPETELEGEEEKLSVRHKRARIAESSIPTQTCSSCSSATVVNTTCRSTRSSSNPTGIASRWPSSGMWRRIRRMWMLRTRWSPLTPRSWSRSGTRSRWRGSHGASVSSIR